MKFMVSCVAPGQRNSGLMSPARAFSPTNLLQSARSPDCLYLRPKSQMLAKVGIVIFCRKWASKTGTKNSTWYLSAISATLTRSLTSFPSSIGRTPLQSIIKKMRSTSGDSSRVIWKLSLSRHPLCFSMASKTGEAWHRITECAGKRHLIPFGGIAIDSTATSANSGSELTSSHTWVAMLSTTSRSFGRSEVRSSFCIIFSRCGRMESGSMSESSSCW
mmetsp:Transcript_2934/g.5061  ORF Transcript_2934/g.5061 Transcript_2934/m.5061 type:complete len:218 (-) Transcript_2934:232-885(-)